MRAANVRQRVVRHATKPRHSGEYHSQGVPEATNRIFFQIPDTDLRSHHQRFFNIRMIFDNAPQHRLFLWCRKFR
jgi:hypothetical protein